VNVAEEAEAEEFISKHMYGIFKINSFQVVKIKIQQNTSFSIIL